jgi:hypothetical protein
VIADTSAGSFTITMPASPVTGDKIEIVDGSGTFGTNPLTVARNGNKIADIADDLSLNITGAAASFIYNTDTWEVYVQIGSNSGGSVTLSGAQTFTNKTISGSSNTLSNIGNSSLTNSSITLVDESSSTTNISLGETLKITGGSGIDTTISGDTLTVAISEGPAFSAYANSSTQTITSGSQQKVLFQTEEFDTNSNFANSTFTPTVAGYYQLNAEVRLDGASGTGEMMIVIWKNGSEHKRGTNQSGTQIASNFWAMQVSSIVYANGSTDYFEIYVQQGSGGNLTVTAVNSPNITWFNGCKIRGV